jgi:hypothetical protein
MEFDDVLKFINGLALHIDCLQTLKDAGSLRPHTLVAEGRIHQYISSSRPRPPCPRPPCPPGLFTRVRRSLLHALCVRRSLLHASAGLFYTRSQVSFTRLRRSLLHVSAGLFYTRYAFAGLFILSTRALVWMRP